MIQRSYSKNNKGKLYLVPTPIGNMQDITFRAIDILKSVDEIYAEDTRVTGILLKHYNISKKLTSCHKYSEEKGKERLIQLLNEGKSIAYVSDRGTPLISDPGGIIANFAIENNIDVISLPGASALLPAICMSGLDSDRFVFYGFLNSKKSIKESEMKKLVSVPYSLIFYEAPHRLIETLKCMKIIFGNRPISISREITKIYEEVYRGNINEAINTYQKPKGEFVIVLEGNAETEEVNYIEKVKELMLKGYKVSSAIKEVADIYGISKNDLYNKCKEELL